MSNSATCEVCGADDGNLKTYGLAVDGVELNLRPVLCREHGDRFVIRAGFVLAGLARPMNEVFRSFE